MKTKVIKTLTITRVRIEKVEELLLIAYSKYWFLYYERKKDSTNKNIYLLCLETRTPKEKKLKLCSHN